MQLGVVPFLISDIDTRPFKRFINWQESSLFSESASDLNSALDTLQTVGLIAMGKRAAAAWQKLKYQKWCEYVIEELRALR